MDGLTLDVDDELVYWTDVTYQNIQRADLDGGNRRTILSGLGKPRAIVLYKARRFVKSFVLLVGVITFDSFCRLKHVDLDVTL